MVALNEEVKALRKGTLQNREALDYLLAGQGGTCALIGDECCTFVPDVSSNVTDLSNYIATVAKSHSGELEWVFTGWLKGLFGALGAQIAQ